MIEDSAVFNDCLGGPVAVLELDRVQVIDFIRRQSHMGFESELPKRSGEGGSLSGVILVSMNVLDIGSNSESPLNRIAPHRPLIGIRRVRRHSYRILPKTRTKRNLV